jgi:hypothetical protein
LEKEREREKRGNRTEGDGKTTKRDAGKKGV